MTESFFSLVLGLIWQIVKSWWWVFLPFFLLYHLKERYYYWVREKWVEQVPMILLEVKMPKDVLKPIKAMDHVFGSLHGLHDIPLWREKWIQGEFQLSLCFEIISDGGNIHFYIRCAEKFRNLVETVVYSQYPEAEITLAKDYTKYVPQDIPNKEWDFYGVDYINPRDEIYPIKTYRKFETEKETKEEKRVDPLAGLLEGLTTLKPGEQFWLQIIAKPILERDKAWKKKGRALADALAKRPLKAKPKPMFHEAAEILVKGAPKEEEKKKPTDMFPPEMRLTPGEKDILTAVEEKLSKFGYDCAIRFAYLAKREAMFKPRTKIGFGFFKDLSTENLGGLKPWSRTMTKVKSVPLWFLDKRRLYLRKRRMFKNYHKRWSPFFPRSGGTFVLNTEELATLYHFPGELMAPAAGVSRVEAKKSEPPSRLPVE